MADESISQNFSKNPDPQEKPVSGDDITPSQEQQPLPYRLPKSLIEWLARINRPYLPLFSIFSFSITALSLVLVYLVQRTRLPHAHLWSVHLLFLSIPFFLKTPGLSISSTSPSPRPS
jgi:hypothetical protein